MKKIGLICVLLTAWVSLTVFTAPSVQAAQVDDPADGIGPPGGDLLFDPDDGDDVEGDPDDIIEGNKQAVGTFGSDDEPGGDFGDVAFIKQVMRYLQLIIWLQR